MALSDLKVPTQAANLRFLKACNAMAIALEAYRKEPSKANEEALRKAKRVQLAARDDVG